jgi:flagellar basal-body rod protein FlgB
MDPKPVDLFGLAEKRLAWLDRRQQVLAANIANADTPGWQPKDLKPFAETLADSTPTLERTNPLHLAAFGEGTPPIDRSLKPEEKAPDGNAVAIDRELAKVAETSDTHAFVVNLYQTYMGLFRTVLTG